MEQKPQAEIVQIKSVPALVNCLRRLSDSRPDIEPERRERAAVLAQVWAELKPQLPSGRRPKVLDLTQLPQTSFVAPAGQSLFSKTAALEESVFGDNHNGQ
jgi:hypothetical protein